MCYSPVTCECGSFPRDQTESADELTSLSQSVKADVRVKTVGFFTSLQTRLETKLVTPWMYHLPSWPRQFRGPPESPWVRDRNSVWSSWPFFISDGNMFSFVAALTHIASGHDVSSCTDHGALDGAAPPVAATAHTVLHHRQQGLLQLVRHRTVS